MRGAALRSSRSEPFGERFLRQALRCTMTGDIAGLHAAYLDTVAAIRDRALPAADLATRVRLSKSPDAYLAARASHRELAYEALLAAGRTEWAPGERVRCYRATDQSYVWLPDETEDFEFNDADEEDDRRPSTADNRLSTTHVSGALSTQYTVRVTIGATTTSSTACKRWSPPTPGGCAKPSRPTTSRSSSAKTIRLACSTSRSTAFNLAGFAALGNS